MEYLPIHKDIEEKLNFFISNQKIPNIIFMDHQEAGKEQ